MNDTAIAKKKDGEFLSTLARGLSVLRSFTKDRPEMTLSEVAAVTDLNPAVARRCLNTLVELGELFTSCVPGCRFAGSFAPAELADDPGPDGFGPADHGHVQLSGHHLQSGCRWGR